LKSSEPEHCAVAQFLGELYNDLVIDSHVVFDALYTLMSPGSERTGPLPDPPGDLFRARLVCALLDSCGHYFDTGAAAKRLNLFLAHFDRCA
jgi:regulator of nonsense transcripts 2